MALSSHFVGYFRSGAKMLVQSVSERIVVPTHSLINISYVSYFWIAGKTSCSGLGWESCVHMPSARTVDFRSRHFFPCLSLSIGRVRNPASIRLHPACVPITTRTTCWSRFFVTS
eukprot:m.55570 g.55570  ORF g.55570 m.55570 type:complete len:115 (-) comp9254_c0_seq2:728-1072(-)